MRAGLRGGRMFHGGAGLAPSAARGAVFPDDEETEAGRRVGAFAARLMEPVERIVIDAGPIAYAFAQAIPEDFAGCVITHSMPVPQLFDQRATAARTVALGVAPGPRQRRVQDRDGGPLGRRVGECGHRGARLGRAGRWPGRPAASRSGRARRWPGHGRPRRPREGPAPDQGRGGPERPGARETAAPRPRWPRTTRTRQLLSYPEGTASPGRRQRAIDGR